MIKYILCLILVANISLFLYACILARRKFDEEIEKMENYENEITEKLENQI